MKKKIIRMIIILAILLFILISVYLFNPVVRAELKLNEINISNKIVEDMKIPENLHYIIGNYNGALTTEIISKTYNYYAESIIPKYFKKCKDLDSEKLKEYFNFNKDLIYIELAYNKFEDFEEFVNKIKNLKGDTLEFESYRILDNSTYRKSRKLFSYIEFKYKNNEPIVFVSEINSTIQQDCSSIILDIDIDEEIIEKDKQSSEERKKLQESQQSPFTRGSPIE